MRSWEVGRLGGKARLQTTDDSENRRTEGFLDRISRIFYSPRRRGGRKGFFALADFAQKLPGILYLLPSLVEKETGMQYIEIVLRYILSTVEDMGTRELKEMV